MNATKENPQRTSSERSAGSPKQGEKFRCSKCGMELQINKDCRCNDPAMAHFSCCGQSLDKM